MEHRSLICLMYCVSFSLTVCKNITGPGVCMQPNSSIITCCFGYILKENMCFECEPGTTGENCSMTCPPGYYGLFCSKPCLCSSEMFCDPIRGCLCNPNSVNCTDQDQKLTTEYAENSTVYKSNHKSQFIDENIIPSLVFAITVLLISIICIRLLYSKIMKRKDIQSAQNVQTDNPAPCLGLNPDALPQQTIKSVNINCHLQNTTKQRVDEEMDNISCKAIQNQSSDRQTDKTTHPCKTTINHSVNTKQGKRKNGGKTVMLKFPDSQSDSVSRKRKMQVKYSITQEPSSDKELYANQADLTHTNKSYTPDSQMDK